MLFQAKLVKGCLGILVNSESIRFFPYPPDGHGYIVSNRDLILLKEGGKLNDLLIDWYLEYRHRECGEESKKNMSIFSTFFFGN